MITTDLKQFFLKNTNKPSLLLINTINYNNILQVAILTIELCLAHTLKTKKNHSQKSPSQKYQFEIGEAHSLGDRMM